MAIFRKVIRIVRYLLAIIVVFVLFSNLWIIGTTRNQILVANDIKSASRTALLLGTSYNTVEGDTNPFFHNRIVTAAELYKLGHVNKIILSGSTTKYYNEPLAMRNSLANLDVPDSILVNDEGGVRTLDSVVRCKELFKEDRIIIVTQRFHAYRALFISNYYRLDAVVVITPQVSPTNSFKVLLREFMARPLAVLDLYVMHSKPKFETAVIY